MRRIEIIEIRLPPRGNYMCVVWYKYDGFCPFELPNLLTNKEEARTELYKWFFFCSKPYPPLLSTLTCKAFIYNTCAYINRRTTASSHYFSSNTFNSLMLRSIYVDRRKSFVDQNRRTHLAFTINGCVCHAVTVNERLASAWPACSGRTGSVTVA